MFPQQEKNLLEAAAHNDATAVDYLIRQCEMSPVREIEKKKNKVSPIREAALSDSKNDITEQWAALDILARAVINDPLRWVGDCDGIATEAEMEHVNNPALLKVGGDDKELQARKNVCSLILYPRRNYQTLLNALHDSCGPRLIFLPIRSPLGQVINHVDSFGCSLLYYCVLKNAHGAVAELLRAGAAVPEVCLHTAVDNGALEAIRLILPKLRSAETVAADERGRRQSIVVTEDQRQHEKRPPAPGLFVVTRLLNWRRRGAAASGGETGGARPPKAANVRRDRDSHRAARDMKPHISQEYLECLALHAAANVKKMKRKPDNAYTAAAAVETAGFDHATTRYKRSVEMLGAILQFCQPQWRFFRRCLEDYLIEVLCGEELEAYREAMLDEFVENASFPLHHALAAARACQKVARSKTLYRELLNKYSLRFEKVVDDIISECEDADEAEEILPVLILHATTFSD